MKKDDLAVFSLLYDVDECKTGLCSEPGLEADPPIGKNIFNMSALINQQNQRISVIQVDNIHVLIIELGVLESSFSKFTVCVLSSKNILPPPGCLCQWV